MTGAWHVYRRGRALGAHRAERLAVARRRTASWPCSSAGPCSSCSTARASASTPRCAASGPTCSTTTRRSPSRSSVRARAHAARAADRRGAARSDGRGGHRQRRALRGAVRPAHRSLGPARRHLGRDADCPARAIAARSAGRCARRRTAAEARSTARGAARAAAAPCAAGVRATRRARVHWCPACQIFANSAICLLFVAMRINANDFAAAADTGIGESADSPPWGYPHRDRERRPADHLPHRRRPRDRSRGSAHGALSRAEHPRRRRGQ